MTIDNTLLVSQLVVGQIYQDTISNVLVFIIGAGTGRYYNAASGLFESYVPYDNSLFDPNPATA